VLWDAVSWTGTADADLQAESLGSLLLWLCSRTLPPRQLRLNLRLQVGEDWVLPDAVAPDAVAQSWVLLGSVLACCAPRLQRLTIVQVRRAAACSCSPAS